MVDQVKLEGWDQLIKNLNELHVDLTEKAARSAVVGAASLVRADAKKRAKAQGLELSGALLENIAIKRERTPKGRHQYHVGVRHGRKSKRARKVINFSGGRRRVTYENDPFYWWFHEFGTSKMPARPFLRPAFEENQQRILETMATRIRKSLDKFKAKYG